MADAYSSSDDLQQMLQQAGLGTGPQAQPLANPGLPAPYGQQQPQGAFDPSTVSAMLALHGQRNEMGNIDRSRKLADQMRSDASGLMKPKTVGRVVVGPKWWDLAANLAANAQATRDDLTANEKAKGLDTTFGTTMQDIIDKYNANSQANR